MAKSKVDQDRTIQTENRPVEPAHRDRRASLVLAAIQTSIETEERLAKHCLNDIILMADLITETLRRGGQVAFFGNGGSAADAQHISAELVGKFKSPKRPPLKAMALTTNTSVLTAIGNDLSFDEIFARQVRANLEQGDIAVGISTSGRSKNVINAILEAKQVGAKTIALTGSLGTELASICDHSVIVPSSDTQKIQECHIMIGHVVCELVEEALK